MYKKVKIDGTLKYIISLDPGYLVYFNFVISTLNFREG